MINSLGNALIGLFTLFCYCYAGAYMYLTLATTGQDKWFYLCVLCATLQYINNKKEEK